jgi:hypothetical protein
MPCRGHRTWTLAQFAQICCAARVDEVDFRRAFVSQMRSDNARSDGGTGWWLDAWQIE